MRCFPDFFDDDDDDEHDEEPRLNSVRCGFGGGNFFEKLMEVERL
jgi:hypothetical protein